MKQLTAKIGLVAIIIALWAESVELSFVVALAVCGGTGGWSLLFELCGLRKAEWGWDWDGGADCLRSFI